MKLITDQDIYEDRKRGVLNRIRHAKERVKYLQDKFIDLDASVKRQDIDLLFLQSELRLINTKLGQKTPIQSQE